MSAKQSRSRRAPSAAALEAREELRSISPEAAAALGSTFTVADVHQATISALKASKSASPQLVALNTKVPEALKAQAQEHARTEGLTLQALVTAALESYLSLENPS